MLQAIQATNFKKLENFSASFSDGTNLICGENGQGKTTVFEAIRFALFGAKALTAKTDELTTWGKSGMSVSLTFNGYTVRRTAGNAQVTNADGKKVVTGNAPTTAWCCEQLGCDAKDFDLLFMSQQGETAGIINFGAAELNRRVEYYAGVATIDTIIKSLGSKRHRLQGQLESVEYVDTEQTTAAIASVGCELSAVKASVDQLTFEADTAKAAVTITESEIRTANAHNNTQAARAKANSEYERKKASAEAALSSAESQAKAASEELDKLTKPDQDWYAEIETALADLISLRTTISNKEQQVKQAKYAANHEAEQAKKYEESIEKYEQYKKTREPLAQAVELAQNKVNEQASLGADLAKAHKEAVAEAESGICPTCERPHDNFDKVAADAKVAECAAKLDEARGLYGEANKSLHEAKAALSSHDETNPGDQSGQLAKAKEKAAQQSALASKYADELAGLTAGLAANHGSYDENHYQQQKAEYQANVKLWNAAVRASKQASAALEAAQSQMDAVNATVCEDVEPMIDTTTLQEELDAQRSQADDKASALSAQRTQAAILSEKKASLDKELSIAKANNDRIGQVKKRYDLTCQLIKYLSEERIKFMEAVWATILGRASWFVNKSTNGWITAVGRNKSGDFTFTENGYEAVAKSSASGAQKEFIGTALKVGIAHAKMGASSMLLLDEPTAGMRDDNAGLLAAGLLAVSGQKVMITHRNAERMTAQNVITVGRFYE